MSLFFCKKFVDVCNIISNVHILDLLNAELDTHIITDLFRDRLNRVVTILAETWAIA